MSKDENKLNKISGDEKIKKNKNGVKNGKDDKNDALLKNAKKEKSAEKTGKAVKSKKNKKPAKTKVLFVCTGNTCRSPMAEQLFKHFLRQKKELSLFEVTSAGIYADEGAKINANAEAALTVLGVKPKPQTSLQLTEAMIKNADIIVCMTAGHKAAIEGGGCVLSLGEVTGANDAPDPYGGDLDRYLAVAKYLQYACTDIYKAAKNLKTKE